MKKTLRHAWIRVVEFIRDPLAHVEFDENDVPVVTFYVQR